MNIRNMDFSVVAAINSLLVTGVKEGSGICRAESTIFQELESTNKSFSSESIRNAFDYIKQKGIPKPIKCTPGNSNQPVSERTTKEAIIAIFRLSSYGVWHNGELTRDRSVVTLRLITGSNSFSLDQIQAAYDKINERPARENTSMDARLQEIENHLLSISSQQAQETLSQFDSREAQNIFSHMVNKQVFSYPPRTKLEDEGKQNLLNLGGQLHYLSLADQTILEFLTISPAITNVTALDSVSASTKIEANQDATVIILPGIGGCYEHFEGYAKFYLSRKFNVVLFNRRGTCNSLGVASEENYYLDLEHIFNKIKSKFCPQDRQFLIHGYSLGGAIASEMGKRYPKVNLFLDRTFSAMAEVVQMEAKRKYGSDKAYLPAARALIQQLPLFRSASKLETLEGHLCILRSMQDEIIPTSCADKLKEAARKSAHTTCIDIDGGHGKGWLDQDSKVVDELQQFLVRAELAHFP